MDNPLAPKREEIAKGGQMAVVIGFVATFLLGVVFVFVIGNLFGQVSDGIQAINVELTGTKKLVVTTSANACVYAYVQADNNAVLTDAEKTDAAKMEEVLNSYNAEKLASLSTKVLDCTVAATPSYITYEASGTTVAKTGEGLTVESALNAILK